MLLFGQPLRYPVPQGAAIIATTRGEQSVPAFAAPDLQRMAAIMMRANLVGHDSHSVLYIPGERGRGRSGQIRPGTSVEIVHERPTAAILNGNFTMGHVVVTKAMQVGVAQAKQCVSAAVSVHNLNHVGRVGTYPLRAAAQGLGVSIPANSGVASTLR